jgi:N-formylglutamate amidohydrolase
MQIDANKESRNLSSMPAETQAGLLGGMQLIRREMEKRRQHTTLSDSEDSDCGDNDENEWDD